jgi:hypothetical protein
MRLRLPISGISGCLLMVCAAAGTLQAQQLIGYVNTRDAEITGASDVLDGQAVLTGSAGITARDHTAPITLGRGGTVRVCQTSVLHVSESRSAKIDAPLLFSLDRGAIEIHMAGTLNDSILTPDLRFTVVNAGPLDLRVRVARNGDTCVDNRGPAAPTLNISDPFGEALYQVSAGQHVLFEHGSLHEVVDHERSPCGCPDEKGMSVADALLASGGTKTVAPVAAAPPAVQVTAPPAVAAAVQPALTAQPAAQPDLQAELHSAEQTAAHSAVRAAEQHPFPTAISEGLAPAPEIPQAAPGTVHAQIADTLSYNAPVSTPATTAAASSPAIHGKKPKAAKAAETATPAQPVAAPAAKPQSNDVVHVLGRFFKRIFGG